jgi:ketopantoate reductase
MMLSVTTRAVTWKYLLDAGSALVLVRLVRETGRLAHALGIELTDRSVLPVASLCRHSEEDAVQAVMKVGREFKANAPEHRMSSLQDLEAGRRLEIEETLGHASRQAAQLGLALPLFDSFYRVVAAIDRAGVE